VLELLVLEQQELQALAQVQQELEPGLVLVAVRGSLVAIRERPLGSVNLEAVMVWRHDSALVAVPHTRQQ